MKTNLTVLFVCLFTATITAQNVDWVNAPYNPIPQGADLKFHNLKGDVLQVNTLDYFNRKGEWFSYDGSEKVEKDVKGRVIAFTTRFKTINYKYDNKGNLISADAVTYEYDTKNRLIKAVFKNQTTTYSYKTEGERLIVAVTTNYSGHLNTAEYHYKNGLKINLVSDVTPTYYYAYSYDERGNWVSLKHTYANTGKPVLSTLSGKPIQETRDIIYYSDYDKGANAFTVKLDDVTRGQGPKRSFLVRSLINGKELKRSILVRFINDYVLFDPIATHYYIARGAYAETNKDGQQLSLERISTDSSTILLYNGKNVTIIEKGIQAKPITTWKYGNHLSIFSCFSAYNTQNGSAYIFENIPAITNGKTIALHGKLISATGNNLWYVNSIDKKSVKVFEKGEGVSGNYGLAGYLVSTGEPVVSMDGIPKYILENFTYSGEGGKLKVARYFDAAKDKITATNTTRQPQTSKNQ